MGQPKRRPGRGNVYYANVRIGNLRLRESLNTDNYQEAMRRQRELVAKVEAGQITAAHNAQWSGYRLSEALDVLHQQRSDAGQKEGTLRIERERAKPLKRLLGTVALRKIDGENVRAYQAQRLAERVSQRTVAMELELLRLLLKKIKRWDRIKDDIKMTKAQESIGRAITQEEKTRLFRVAQSNPNWYRALYVAVIAINTGARKHEILNARFEDVDLFTCQWRISKSKTRAGLREVALNPEAQRAFARMLEAAEALGGVSPKNFVFCACENKNFDYTRPQRSVRSAWRTLTAKAGLKGLRVHDLRHSAISDLAEAGVPESVMLSMVGHVSRRMLERYTHIRTGAKERAAAALGGTGILDTDQPVVSTKQ